MDSEDKKPKLGLRGISLYIICSIITIDSIPSAARIGAESVVWWILGIIFFFVPYGLVVAELGSAFPETQEEVGGIFYWVNRAFGDFAGTMVSWIFWLDVGLWMPSVYITFATIFQTVFLGFLSEEWIQVTRLSITVGLVWLTVLVGVRNTYLGEIFTNIGAFLKIGILVVLTILGIYYIVGHKSKTDFIHSDYSIFSLGKLPMVPVILFNFLGFEVVSVLSKDMKDPKKDFPRSIAISGLIISIIYILSTIGILIVIPGKDINIVTGLNDAFMQLINSSLGNNYSWLYYLMVTTLLFALFATMIAWSIGANGVMVETGLDKKVKFFSHRHSKYESPDYAFYVMGIIASSICVLNFVGLESIKQIYWTIFALSSMLLLFPYMMIFPAFIKLRISEPNVMRPFRIPVNIFGAVLLVISAEICILVTFGLYYIPPEEAVDKTRYIVSLVSGTIVSLLSGTIIYYTGKKKSV
ncbi:MAG: APC family permease [Leptospiraceae bacterium]|nr:APC family permease [Leptospiraceae bacterium]